MNVQVATVALLLLASTSHVWARLEMDDAERACGLIYDYAKKASRERRWPPTEHAARRLPSLYERCAKHEEACLATREELEDRGLDDGQLNCEED